ncbi:unnamed protein product [Hapterophycus canaliculatus]
MRNRASFSCRGRRRRSWFGALTLFTTPFEAFGGIFCVLCGVELPSVETRAIAGLRDRPGSGVCLLPLVAFVVWRDVIRCDIVCMCLRSTGGTSGRLTIEQISVVETIEV